jgi:DNA-binding NtrC family response regulator
MAGSTAEDILVVDGDPAVRDGLTALLRGADLEVTAVGDHDRARDQLANRFFSVLLVDLDGPAPKAGLDLVRLARERSPLTAVIVLTPRRTFDDVASAFRAGAVDVVPKTQDNLPYLRQRVVEAVRALRADRARERLLTDVSELHERFLSQMMTLARQVTDLEEKIADLRGDGPAAVPTFAPLSVLVVDDDPGLAAMVQRSLTDGREWVVRSAESSGGALDQASQSPPQVLVVKDGLSDLPATMLITALRGAVPELVALMVSPPISPPAAPRSGEVRLFEGSRVTTIIPTFDDPAQLLGALEEVKEALQHKARERRHLMAFRRTHADFLKLYGGLKQRLATRSKA